MAGKPKRYEGSKADIAEDKRGAKRMGVTLKAYEKTARDRAQDRRGAAKMRRGRKR